MSTSAASRKSRYAPTVVTKNELLDLLNDDFTRECKAIYAHAVFAERLKSADAEGARRISRAGQQTVLESLALCQLIYDYGGTVKHNLDEINAVLSADRVAAADWGPESIRRLHQRVGQLRAAGEPGLAKRIRRIIASKRARKSLCDLLAQTGERTLL
jgi:hypothetical protein